MLEFLIMIPFALVIILGAIQLALIFNAHSMLKLAAFNAARAAIVAQGAKPEDPATVGDAVGFLKPAHTAAVFTLLPVIPALHGTMPSADGLKKIAQGASLDTSNLGTTAALIELAMVEVDFLKKDDPIDASPITSWPQRIDFDDPARAADNVVKVRVHWDYPLVIPYINRILAAIGNPAAYQAYKIAIRGGALPTPEEVLNDLNKPAWQYADFLAQSPTGSPVADAALNNLLLRWPMNTTHVMRMQWDRKP